MNVKLLIFGAAAALVTAGAAQAASTWSRTYAEPAQPIAYSKLGAYLKASSHQRATRDWTNPTMASAAGMNAANVSATQTAPTAQPAPAPSAPAQSAPAQAPQAAPADQMQAPAAAPDAGAAPPPQ